MEVKKAHTDTKKTGGSLRCKMEERKGSTDRGKEEPESLSDAAVESIPMKSPGEQLDSFDHELRGYNSYFTPSSSWHSAFFGCFDTNIKIFKQEAQNKWIKPLLICFPCVLAGWIESCEQRESVSDTPVASRMGLGERGCRVCQTGCIESICFPYACLATVQQRGRIMDTYGIRGGLYEEIKGICFPCALFQHYVFLMQKKDESALRFPWESGKVWSVKDRPPTEEVKILILGSSGAGKTALFHVMLGQNFPTPYTPDVEANIGVKIVEPRNHYTCLAQLWDIPANSKADTKGSFFRHALGAFVLFELDSYITWKEALEWIDSFVDEFHLNNCNKKSPGETQQNTLKLDAPIITLVGTKTDICDPEGCQFLAEVQAFKEKNKNMTIAFVSSWRKDGISSLLHDIIYKICQESISTAIETDPERISILSHHSRFIDR